MSWRGTSSLSVSASLVLIQSVPYFCQQVTNSTCSIVSSEVSMMNEKEHARSTYMITSITFLARGPDRLRIDFMIEITRLDPR